MVVCFVCGCPVVCTSLFVVCLLVYVETFCVSVGLRGWLVRALVCVIGWLVGCLIARVFVCVACLLACVIVCVRACMVGWLVVCGFICVVV